ncbi:uncharacterized protein LOC115915166 isoform X1 [Camarhynchus parvulus]|uniref:Uncharacterized protein n=1 Tax=Geospiza parvula TaxID=87175 RepID=A0A8C3MRL5_GEOPR|nr:uncharacterized protein LOC115915166 isoform X1 [Camarhynchus parvulus]XP_030824182.1 uncharacterized protein LOC115915166 isoform X1 [Camarhynchus parvulus]XP_030824183.1 uncharacterized protein LOC115915166 isoform X1 [Camarhynchus parvulus]
MEEIRVYSGFLGMERNKRAGHSMEMKPEARVACQVMLAVLFAALLITAIAFAVQAFQPHAQPCFQCPFDWIRYRGKCYYFSEVEGNWTSSQDNCSALGASLAMLDSTEDLSFVMRYKGISEHWIGLLREDEEQPWLWVNRSPLSHLRAAWPQQPHKTPVLTLARDSSLGAEGTKAPQEAMGETTQAVVMKTFGGPDETCEEMSEAERCRIKAEFERLRRLRAERERAVLRRLAELDGTFAATQAEKSLQVAEGVAQLHRLIRQLEAKCLPQDVGRILSSLSEMRLHLPSGLPKQLEKSLSSCCHQSDALWEALEKFRASVLGQLSQGISGFCPNQQLASVVAAVQELALLLAQDLCHRHQCPLIVFCHCDRVLVCTACTSIVPTPPCCSKRLLAATRSINPFSLQKQFEASQKTL